MQEQGAKILVIDDEPEIRKLLKVSLLAHNYVVEEAVSGKDGIRRVALFKPDLIILDLGLPDMDGKNVVKSIRDWSAVPIIVLSVRDQEEEKIAALDNGADDYITKPFSVRELFARIRVALRRMATAEQEPIIHCGEITIDLSTRHVTVNDEEVKLTPTEYELLKILMVYRGRVITHRQLLKAVWGSAYEADTQYVRVYMGQLRRKLEKDPARPQYIITESGVGYRFMCP